MHDPERSTMFHGCLKVIDIGQSAGRPLKTPQSLISKSEPLDDVLPELFHHFYKYIQYRFTHPVPQL